MPYKDPEKRRARAREKYATDPDFRARSNASKNKWAKKNPEKRRGYRDKWRAKKPEDALASFRRSTRKIRMRERGVTEDQFADCWGQPTHCRSCGTRDPGHKHGFAMDHCHATGRMRAVVCHPCNFIFGHAKDNPAILRAGAHYLETV